MPVASLVPRPTVADDLKASTIRTLERGLKEARCGDVIEIIIVEKHLDGTWTHLASQTNGIREHIGALELIKAELIFKHLGRD